ncbi:MAG: hypothetical protein IPL24_09260 [Bacteroidetes bacterium]|nr:hypothetical protein [Bacteroidota bacterium]
MNATLTHTKQGRLSSSNTTLLLLFFCSLFFAISVSANVTITRATGGSISADKAANAISPTYTTLGNVRLTEGATSDFAAGTNLTLTLNAPTGWNFNPAANITVTATASRNITSPIILSKTSTIITVQFNVTGTTLADVLTISGIQVWATDGAKQSVNGNITRGGTATIAGCAAGANLGTLRTTVGATRLVVTLPGQTLTDATTFAGSGFTGTPSTRTANTSFSLTRITACDQFYNRITTYTGAKTISYTGPGTALSAPTFTTAVSFTSGQSTTTLTTKLTKAEVTTLTVTDGTFSGVTSTNFTVQPGAHNNFIVEADGGGIIGTQIAGTAFSLRITARDIQNNTCSSGTNNFTGTVNLTSTGTLTTGGGTSAAFVAGVLSGKVVNISNTGNRTITVTRTSSTQTGTSNAFDVENPVPTIASISAPCKTTGSPNFTLTVTGTFFNATTIIKVDGVNRTTTYISATSVQATILAADMSVAATKSITAFNPTLGGGTSSPAIMTVSTIPVIVTQPVSQEVCSGSTAIFTASATGFGISYQWKKNGIALADGGNVSGVNTPTLTISNADAGDASTNYTVSILSACFADVVSSSVSLDVDATTDGGALPLLTEHCSGNASGTLNLTGNLGEVIQWEWSLDNFATAGNVISNTTITYNYTNLSATTYFRVLVKSGVCPEAYSSVATVVVNSLPAVPADPSASTPQCIDSTITLTRLTPPSGETWYWQSAATGTSISESGINKYVTTSGTYFVRSQNDLTGCWSSGAGSVTVNLNAATTGSQTLSVCDGTNVTLPDASVVTTTGVYFSHLTNASGCDSTITTNLTVIPNTTSTQTVSICDGATHTLPDGATATTTGTYVSHISNAAGCDSTITTNLTVIPNTTSTQTVSICDGATHTLPDGATATVSGTYVSHILNAAGCDSTITTNLTVIPNTTSTQDVSICDGATHTLPDGAIATVTGTYVSHIANAAGCDSTITTNLTVIPNTTSTQTVSICDGATHTLPDGVTTTITGTYVSHIANAAGCDSTITTNLTVIPNTTSTQTLSICDGATHTLPDGATATVTGVYICHIANAAGCDSTITTNLTVIPNTTSTQTVSICDGATHTLPDGAFATVTGVYVSHISNAAGCDSTITTNLTVIPNTTSTQTVSICDGATHTLPDGATATVTGTYVSHIANAAGCDSTITTNLTVIPNTTSTQTVSICDGATHTLPDGASATISGVYVSHVANAAGCDSTITTNLTVISNTTSTQTVSICDGAMHTLPDGASATISGTYVSHIANAAGCDSTITTNLTVIPNTTSAQTVSICDGATHTLPDGASATILECMFLILQMLRDVIQRSQRT